MKKVTITTALIAFAAGITLVACGSPDKKVENAEEKVEKKAEDLQDAKEDLKEVKQEAKQDSVAEYNKFKADAEEQLKQNEQKIADLWAKKSKESTTKAERDNYKKRIDELERRNKELKAKLARQDDPKKHIKWVQFKEEFNHDMDELNKSLKDFTVDNKK